MHEAEWALKKFGNQINEQLHHIVSLFKSHEWSYEGECGPQTWSSLYPGARGHHQSPINIETELTKFEPKLLERPLEIHFDLNCCTQIKNTGFTFQVDAHTNNQAFVKGGPTNHTYQFLQFHMHWGDSLEKGSEHLINSKPYSAELHFVYWNNDLYPDPKQASESSKNDGLLVLGVFVKVGKHCPEFEKLSNSIHDIHLKDHHVPIRSFDIRKLLPADISAYWTYPGSLTTPPCNECVQWVVFRDYIEISEDQLEKCHHLYSVSKERLCSEKTTIKYNDRPVCSMDDRVVLRSFE